MAAMLFQATIPVNCVYEARLRQKIGLKDLSFRVKSPLNQIYRAQLHSNTAAAEYAPFKVTRQPPKLIRPSQPTPYELKPLSDIDDQEFLRKQIPVIMFYPANVTMQGKDPAKIIHAAIGRALVFYYPLAGRLREVEGRKLVVECTGDGVMFIEADADVTLKHFGDQIRPPFHGLEELLYDVPGSGEIINSPLLLIQLTRLQCNGFIVAVRFNHTITDGVGINQFLTTVVELARGAAAPSVPPVWERHLFNARDPPRVSFTHREYDNIPYPEVIPIDDDMAHRYFFIGAGEISAIRRRHLSPDLRCSTFDILTACIWRCRTIATLQDPNEETRIGIAVNCRNQLDPPLPTGYYGNTLAFPVAISTTGRISKNPLEYAIKLVREAKASVTPEYMKSVADFMVIRGRPCLTLVGTYGISDTTGIFRGDKEFGWGKAAYVGPPIGSWGIPSILSWYIHSNNDRGDPGILFSICLPVKAMEVFVKEMETMVKI